MKLNYTEQGAGTAVILIHGIFGSLSNLGNLARNLSAGYRVLSVDLRNHGDSPHEQSMDLQLMAADIVELMDDLALGTAHLVGHSMGGKVAMQLAMNYPQRVDSLLVADIAPADYPQQNINVINALASISKVSIESRKMADNELVRYQIDAPTRAFILKGLRRESNGQFVLKFNLSSIVANYARKLALAPVGQPYTGPSLFLKGQTSAYIQDKHIPVIESLFPQSTLQVVQGAGHWLHAEKPDDFNNLVSAFLGANS
ncbi:MAG: alpha/beta fold hydrolase [Porticoccaceae bacterium]|nr:alpha/beta fold hydrolase [Porticoccaceae bacterium]